MFYSALDRMPKLDVDDFQAAITDIKVTTKIKNKNTMTIEIQSTLTIGGGVTGRPFEDTITVEITYLHISKPAQKPITDPSKTTKTFSIKELVNN